MATTITVARPSISPTGTTGVIGDDVGPFQQLLRDVSGTQGFHQQSSMMSTADADNEHNLSDGKEPNAGSFVDSEGKVYLHADETDVAHKPVSFADLLKKSANLMCGKGKLTYYPPVVTELGTRRAIIPDDLVQKQANEWVLTLAGYFIEHPKWTADKKEVDYYVEKRGVGLEPKLDYFIDRWERVFGKELDGKLRGFTLPDRIDVGDDDDDVTSDDDVLSDHDTLMDTRPKKVSWSDRQEEQERKHVASSVETYMKQDNVKEEDVRDYLYKKVEEAWKDINRESLVIKDVPRPLVMCVINMTRSTNYIFKDGHSFTHVGEELIDHIKS
ncbi:hypothetical protein OSB04_001305, partial [Centaurea solstitialis]